VNFNTESELSAVLKVVAAGALSCVATLASAQGLTGKTAVPALPGRSLSGFVDMNDGGWISQRMTADQFMQDQQDRRLGIMHSTPGSPQAPPDGPKFDITGKIIGALQYHWTAGQKPELGWRGLPIRAKIRTNGFYFGFTYRTHK
jgi:hypothetical protein